MANFLTVIHECKDFPAWKKVYEADATKRSAAGLTEMHVLREHDNANLVALVFGVSDMERAKGFVTSPELAAAMKTAGIVGPPKAKISARKLHP